MVLQSILLVGWLIGAPLLSAPRGVQGLEEVEGRLQALLVALADLGTTPVPEKELYYNMECGFALLELERYPPARPHFERGVELSRELSEPGMLITNLSALIDVSFQTGELERARSLCGEGLAVAESTNRADHVAALATSLGSVELRLGNYAAAVDALSRALESSDEQDDPGARAALLSNLAVAYMSLSSYDEALVALDRALPLMVETGSHEGVAAVLSNQGDVLFLAGDAEAGLELMHEALAVREKHGLKGGSSISHRSIAQALHAMGEYARALASFERALAIQRELHLQPEIVATPGRHRSDIRGSRPLRRG